MPVEKLCMNIVAPRLAKWYTTILFRAHRFARFSPVTTRKGSWKEGTGKTKTDLAVFTPNQPHREQQLTNKPVHCCIQNCFQIDFNHIQMFVPLRLSDCLPLGDDVPPQQRHFFSW